MINIPISLEFFPPKTPEGMTKLAAARAQLYALKPEFCSVTYGAGGSTQAGTLQVVREIRDEGAIGVPHFTCIGATRASVGETLDAFKAARLQLSKLNAKLTVLTQEQAAYIGVAQSGPYKPDTYRY